MTSPDAPLVRVSGVDKRFGSTHALRGVGLTIDAGQCLGLVGRNGAGKSTLVSILSGLIAPDAGTIEFAGRPAPAVGSVAAWHEWIATVFQHSMVVPDLTVAENVFLGDTGRFIGWRDLRTRTREIMADWGYDIDATAPCRDLSVEQRQIVEITRALARGARCVLLDEPTAALERDAVRRLFERVRQLVAGGVAVLYISHHLEEVFEICQDAAVLRDGALVLSAPTAQLDRDALVSAMVGDARVTEPAADRGDAIPPAKPAPVKSAPATSAVLTPAPVDPAAAEHVAAPDTPVTPPAVLTVEHLSASSPRGRLADVSLAVAAGEILGVTGLLSAGVATLGRVVAGAEPYDSGRITIRGSAIRTGRRDVAQRAGIGYVPEDRRAEGYVALLGVAENATMTIADRLADRFGLTRPARRAAAAAPITDALSLVSSGPGQPVGELSGGNQQKVTVARTLAHDPGVVVAITPTRGVDVASKALLLEALARVARSRGAGILLCTDELSDLALCDRVVVLVRGEVFAEFTEPPFDRDALIMATEGLTRRGHDGDLVGTERDSR
jgi:simple sugar transport system ATP-binding protein